MIYRTCPYCGAALDPCEICDCREQRTESEARETKERELPGATNTEQLKVEQKSCELQSSASSLPKNERECQG